MKQFDICENLHRAAAKHAPYYVALQSDLLGPLDVRLVAPLVVPASVKPIKKLTPIVELDEEIYLLSMLQLASVRTQYIGKTVGSVSDRRHEIVAALDLLVMGV